MKKYTIKQKMSGTGSIHDIASDLYDRVIEFRGRAQYAVVPAAYYGMRHTTHATAQAAIRQSKKIGDYSHSIIDAYGHEMIIYNDELFRA